MMYPSGIEVYPVGLFLDLLKLRNLLKVRHKGSWKWFWYSFSRSWHRRSYWNGYLAEWHFPPVGMNIYKAGRGWTKRAARRRLGKHIVKSNPYVYLNEKNF